LAIGGHDHPGDLPPALAAEVASRLQLQLRRQAGPAAQPLFALCEHLGGDIDAPIADEDSGAGDQVADLALGSSAKAACPVGQALLDGALARSGIYDLMDPLVAEPKSISDLPQGRTCAVESAHGVLIPHLALIGLVLKVER
jgi:hypothetical protein